MDLTLFTMTAFTLGYECTFFFLYSSAVISIHLSVCVCLPLGTLLIISVIFFPKLGIHFN